MPESKKPEPQFPERDGGSLLKAGIAASPLAVGTAVALKGVASDGSIKQPREAGIDQAMRHLASRTRAPYIPSPDEVTRFMNNQSGDITKQAWKWATHSLDPYSKKRLLGFTEGIEAMTEQEARSAISQTMRNESAAMSRVWRKFQNTSNMLVNHVSMTGNLPQFYNVDDLSTFAQQRTITMATPMPESYLRRVNKIAEAIGATTNIRGITRPEVAMEGFGVWNVSFRGAEVGDFRLQLPQVAGGVLLEGGELQTRRIAPDIVKIGAEGDITRMSRPEFFLREFEKSIVPDIGTRLKTERDVQQATKQLKAKVFGELEATPNVLGEGMTAAQARREALRGMAVDIVVEEETRRGALEYRQGFRPPTDSEISRLMASPEGKEMGLRGGVGPKGLSQGRLSTVEWERFYIGPVDYGRRPEQKMREFQATEQTMEMLGQQKRGQKFRAVQMVGDEVAYANVARPQVRTVYLDPDRHGRLMEELAMGEGEAIARRSTMGKMMFEESKAVKLAEVRADIDDLKNLQAGEILGRTEAGKIFALPQSAEVTGVRRLTESTVQVEYMQQHRLRHGDKIFDAAKAVVLMRDGQEMRKTLQGLDTAFPADLIASTDELKKNRALHRSQVLSSLEDLVTGTWDAQAANRTWSRQAFTAESASHEAWVRSAMRTATEELELTPKEFGRVFGAVPAVMETDELARLSQGLSPQFREAMERGVATGMGGVAYGGPRLEAGVMGSLEPRAFDLLQGQAFGKVGGDISAEFAQRLAVTTPEAVIAHRELGRTLGSMAGEDVGMAGARVFRQGENFQKFIEAGGGILRPGKGLADIYVPGADVMQQLRPFETPSGVQVRGKVSDVYHDLAYRAGLLAEGQMTTAEFQKEADLAADLLRREYAPAGKGIGSVTRGKMIGSRFLRGVSAMGAGPETAMRDAFTVGITQGQFEKMYDELANSKLYTQELKQLEGMKNRFMSGQSVGGMLARHPFIGEFSLQPVQMQMVKGSDDLIVLPELKQNIRVRTALEGEFKEKTLTLGPLVGMAGDKDADAYSAMLVGPRNEEQIRKQLLAQDGEFASRYAQHQVRMQLFKAGKARGGKDMTTLAQMMAEVEKLSVGQKWIAPLSIEMTGAKEALTTFGRGQASADARFLLEWLEQTPISAKHMRAEEAAGGGLQALMMSITDSVRERNQKRLEANIASIVKDDAVAKQMLSGNVFLDKAGSEEITRVIRSQIGTELRGVNVTQATGELMRVLNEADATGATRMTQLLSGRGSRAKMNQIAELTARGAFLSTQESPGVFNKVAAAATEANNLLGRMGRSVIQNHKAIGLGFAGSVALAAILSSPPESVGSGGNTIPDARLYMNRTKAANRLKPEDLHPPGQPIGQPTEPQLMRNQTVRMAMNQPSPNMRVRATVPAGTDLPAMTAQLGSMGGNVSVNLRDSRSMLQPHEIANKLL